MEQFPAGLNETRKNFRGYGKTFRHTRGCPDALRASLGSHIYPRGSESPAEHRNLQGEENGKLQAQPEVSNKTITLSSHLHGQTLDNRSPPWHDCWTQQQPSDPTESQSWLLYQRFLFSLKKPNSNWRMNFTTWALNQFWNNRTWEPKLTFHLQTPLLSPTVIEEILTSWA